MKKLLYIMLLAITPFFFIQCDSEDDLVTENAKEGGLFEATNPSLNYVVGDGKSYAFDFVIFQSPSIKTTSFDVYKSLFKGPVAWSDPKDTTHLTADSIPATWSNEILQETITVTNTLTHSASTTPLDFADLVEGLTIDVVGQEIPTVDADMRIGDYFSFRIVSNLDDGREVEQTTRPKLTIATRFAGAYKCVFAEYYRIGVLTYATANWPAVTQIESVDAITYKVVEYFGAAAFTGNTLYFQIDPVTLKITYPLVWAGVAQTGNDYPIITCDDNPGDFIAAVHCDASNYVAKDDDEGKDKLYMTFGYYNAGDSGARVFYQVMEKIVE